MRFLFIAFILIFVSCKKEKVRLHEDFVFSYTAKNEDVVSLKFINDTVFVARNFPDNDSVYYFLLEETEKIKINDFIDSLQFEKFKDEYYDYGLQDGGSYQFELINRSKKIYVYGLYDLDEIKKLRELAYFISNNYESKRVLLFTNKFRYKGQKLYWRSDVDFGDLERILPPPIDDYIPD